MAKNLFPTNRAISFFALIGLSIRRCISAAIERNARNWVCVCLLTFWGSHSGGKVAVSMMNGNERPLSELSGRSGLSRSKC